jgi:hypothetical protein
MTQPSKRHRGLKVLVLAALLGLLVGSLASSPLGRARAGTCDAEKKSFGSGADVYDDQMDGEDEDNEWYGGAGGDDLKALVCHDLLIRGQSNPDDVGGGSGNDAVEGGDGNDIVRGGIDDDVLWGDGDNDTVNGGGGFGDIDSAHGVAGDDTVDVQDGDALDGAYGGAGNDTCIIDSGDFNNDC